MKVVQFVSHPDTTGSSFTMRAAEQFRRGARDAGHSIFGYHVFHDPIDAVMMQNVISKADHISFSWPCWWEMPPYPMVELLQKVFVKGFLNQFSASFFYRGDDDQNPARLPP